MTALVRPGPAQSLALIAVAVAGTGWVMTGPEDVLTRTALISGAAITLFAARVLPEAMTAILTFLAFIASGLIPTDLVFSGFSAGGFWLLFAGMVMGAAISATGLGRQIALRLFARSGTSYRRAVVLLSVSGLLLGLLVPSAIPRVVVLVPIAAALAEAMGYRPGSRGHVGLVITAATATLMPTYAFLTANLPVIVEAGMIEALYGETQPWGAHLVQQAPINLVRFVAVVAIMIRFAPDDGQEDGGGGIEAPSPLNPAQSRLLALLGLAIALWATDVWHGIAPAWVALSVAALVLWPALGVMSRDAMRSQIDLSPAFLFAGVLCVSAAAEATGLSAALADTLVPMLKLGVGSGIGDLYALTGFSILISHLTTAPAAPVILVPLAASMSEATGWSIETLAMIHSIGIASTILPYQAPPLILAMALAHMPIVALTRVCMLLVLVGLTIGLPVTYLCWGWLGMV